METKEKEAQFEKLWLLLLKDPTKLSKEEINSLLEAKEELHDRLEYEYRAFPGNFERALRYHERKEELSKLSTEELKAMDQQIREESAAFFRSVHAREEAGEDVGDSAFESPSIDSTEHIVYELLKERKTEESVSTK